jgi:hypothetical protein
MLSKISAYNAAMDSKLSPDISYEPWTIIMMIMVITMITLIRVIRVITNSRRSRMVGNGGEWWGLVGNGGEWLG